jgi:hypothetical protein
MSICLHSLTHISSVLVVEDTGGGEGEQALVAADITTFMGNPRLA